MRWKPTRAGILNVWEYDDQEFDFGDGRLVIRGRNGSGKSNALALLFPFLLDGVMSDARMDPMPGGSRSMKSLLLVRDDSVGGGFRHDSGTGYVWMEFADGTDHITLGIGATATINRDAESWFFITPERVGEDLQLTESDVPLGKRLLIERLGTDAVFGTGEDYRQAVDRQLFGLGKVRYRSLVDLLLTLRRPHLAGKLYTEHLAATLSAGLSELDSSLIDDVAHSFDDLDAMQEELEGLAGSLDAVERFLPVYRDHLVGASRERAERVVTSAREVRKLERSRRSTDTELKAAVEAADAAAEELAEAKAIKRGVDRQINDILVSPAYQSATALDEVRKAADTAAQRSVEAAERSENSAELASQAAARHSATTEELHGRTVELTEAIRDWIEVAATAGIDAPFQAESFDDDRAIAVVVERTAQVTRIRELANESELAGSRAAEAERAAEARRIETERAIRERGEAEQDATAQRAALGEAWSGWWNRVSDLVGRLSTQEEPFEVADPEPFAAGPRASPIHEKESVPVEPAAVGTFDRDVERFYDADRWLGQLDTEAARAVERTSLLVDRQDQELVELVTERERVADEPNPGPPANPTRPDATTDTPGAPLYVCVDFSHDIDVGTRAGIESALDAAGILDAQLMPAEHASESFDDAPDFNAYLNAGEHSAGTGRTLADVLVAVPTEDLDAERITSALRSIPLDGDIVQLHDDGRWRLGPLGGRYLHDEPRYIGHASRERRRAERLKELGDHILAAESELAARRSRLQIASALRDEIGERRRDQPPSTSLQHALEDLRHRSDIAVHSESLHGVARGAADDAAALADDASTELHRQAVATHLPTAHADLDVVTGILIQADRRRDTVADRRRSCADAELRLTTAAQDHENAAERSESDAKSAIAADELALLEAARYEHMRTDVGGDAEAAVERLAAARLQLTEADQRTDVLQAEQREAESGASQLEERLRGLADRHSSASQVAADAATAFGVVCSAEIAEVLLVDGVESGADALVAAQHLLADTTAPTDDATNRMERAHREILLDGLRAGHDPSMPKESGIDVVRVGTADGELPIGTLARQLRDEHERTSQLLSKQEREIFETHLLTRIGDSLRSLLLEADAFEHRINAEMAEAPTESGMVVELKWEISSDEAGMRNAVRSLRTSPDMLSPERRESLREFFMARIADLRASDPGRSFAETLTTALDYRAWHTFNLFARFSDGHRNKVTRKFYRGLSGGEAASLLHLPLFAAAAAQYSGGSIDGPRLIALDEAFVGIDDQMRARLMGLLTQLDLDVVLTSHEFWGFYETVPSLVLYDLNRRPPLPGVHAQRFDWTTDAAVDTNTGP